MFNTLYGCSRTIARHENAPLYESRRSYLEHLAAQGSSRKTLRVAAEVIYRAAVYMRLDSSSQVERSRCLLRPFLFGPSSGGGWPSSRVHRESVQKSISGKARKHYFRTFRALKMNSLFWNFWLDITVLQNQSLRTPPFGGSTQTTYNWADGKIR